MKKMKTYQIIIELDNGIVMDSTNKKDKVDVGVYRLDESGMGYSLVHAKKIEGAPTPAPERRLIGFGRW